MVTVGTRSFVVDFKSLVGYIIKPISFPVVHSLVNKCYPRKQGSWGQHGATWVLSAPDGPHVGPMKMLIGTLPTYTSLKLNEIWCCALLYIFYTLLWSSHIWKLIKTCLYAQGSLVSIHGHYFFIDHELSWYWLWKINEPLPFAR